MLRWGDAGEAHRLILEGIERAQKRSDRAPFANASIVADAPETAPHTAGAGNPWIAHAARSVFTSRHATVICPTPPGTGVIAPATSSAS